MANTINYVLNLIISNWEIALCILGLLVVLLVTFTLGAKAGLRVLIAFLLVALCALAVSFVISIIQNGIDEAIRIAIAWGPTALFVLIVLSSTLLGVWRGLRKSLILMAHAVGVAAVCIILYVICINNVWVDVGLLNIINFFMGGNGALQNALGVSASCVTLKEVFGNFIASKTSSFVSWFVYENSVYFMVLVDMAYRIALAIVLLVIYNVLLFILYIIYHCCYSERKYKKRKAERFLLNKTDSVYRKNRIAGGFVGFVRGLTVGLIMMSFIGGAFYAVVGPGNKSSADNIPFIKEGSSEYEIYRSVEDYGAQGILKILNNFGDGDDTPYYLFAADLIFSGKLEDEELGIDENINFRKELTTYTNFARDTLELLNKYGGDTLSDGMNMTNIVKVMSDSQFKAEFENLIDSFEEQTYIINMSMSMVNTIVAHIDDVSFMQSVSESNREILKVMFKRGHLSRYIPDERELIGTAAEATEVRPYINFAKMFKRADAKLIYRVVMNFITGNSGENKAQTLDLVRKSIPEIQKLSILDGERSDYFNPVFGRLYCLLENRYLTADGIDGVRYDEIKREKVSWVKELNLLIDVAENSLSLYDEIRKGESSVMKNLIGIFDETKPEYKDNMAKYDDVCAAVANSRILGKVLASEFMTRTMKTELAAADENIYYPTNIRYENTYDKDGNIVSYGETYQFLYGLKLFAGADNELLQTLINRDTEISQTELVDALPEIVRTADESGKTLAEYITDSSLLRSLLSCMLIENASDFLYIPKVSLEKDADNQAVYMIKKPELKQIFDALEVQSVVDIMRSLADDTFKIEAADLLKDEELIPLLKQGNGILEGTASKFLLESLKSKKFLIVPKALDDIENWISYGDVGELKKFLDAIDASEIEVTELMNSATNDKKVFDKLLEIPSESINVILDSRVFYYTVSDYVQSGDMKIGSDFKVVIPNASRIKLSDDVLSSILTKKDLKAVLVEMSEWDFADNMDSADVLKKLAMNKEALKESKILCASLAHYLVTDDEMCNKILLIPQEYVEAGQEERLIDYEESNLWQSELIYLLDALDMMFGLSESDEKFELTEEIWKDKIDELIPTLNDRAYAYGTESKLTVCYRSKIVLNNLTIKLDEAIDKWESDVVTPEVRQSAKIGKYYRFDELEALTYAVNIFELGNILEVSNDVLEEKVKNSIPSLNNERPEYENKSALELIYPSIIIGRIVTNEIDVALDGGEKPIIDFAVAEKIKNLRGVYPLEEVKALVNSINELGFETVNEINAFDFNDLQGLSEHIDVIYESDIIGGIITYSVKDSMNKSSKKSLVHTDKAYKRNIEIYRKSEITSLIVLLGDSKVEDFDIGKTHEISGYIYDENQNTQSYLLAASLTDNLIKNQGLVITSSVMIDGIIKPEELKRLIDAYEVITGQDEIGKWNVDLHVPSERETEVAVQSEILRATFTDKIRSANIGRDIFVTMDSEIVTESKRMGNYGGVIVPIIGEAEMKNFFNVLRINSDGNVTFEIPLFRTVDDLRAYGDRLPEVLQSDILRYQASGLLIGIPEYLHRADTVTVYDLIYGSKIVDYKVLSAETILELIGG